MRFMRELRMAEHLLLFAVTAQRFRYSEARHPSKPILPARSLASHEASRADLAGWYSRLRGRIAITIKYLSSARHTSFSTHITGYSASGLFLPFIAAYRLYPQ